MSIAESDLIRNRTVVMLNKMVQKEKRSQNSDVRDGIAGLHARRPRPVN